jgi:hypothetical protein
VKLKITLEGPGGKIVTNPNFIQSPIALNFGEALILSGDELSPYLAFDNLVFPSQTFEQNYRQTKVLPEGLWKLCVDVIDATNPSSELLSTNNCALIFVARLQPPMLNLPICETTLPRAQNIFFSWTDMALGSQAIGQEPLYDFSLYSVPLSAYNNPTQVLNKNPIFTTTTTVASFSLDTSEVFLPAGQKYLWQVRAKLPDGSGALDELKYYFDLGKISDINSIKNRMKQVFQQNAVDWFKPLSEGGFGSAKMQQLFGSNMLNSTIFINSLENSAYLDNILSFIKLD